MVDTTETKVARQALTWLGGRPSSTRSTSRRATGRARASTASCRSPASSAPPSSARASTRRARRAPRSGRCAPPAPSATSPSTRYGLDARGHLLRPARPAALDRHGGEPRRTASRPSRAIRASRPSCPGVSTILGLSNVSFGLNPAARQVLNSVFLHECVEAGLDAAIVHASKILPLVAHRRAGPRRSASTSSTTGAPTTTTRCRSCWRCSRASRRHPARPTSTWTGPVDGGSRQRIIDGNRNGLEDDLDRGA